MTLENIHKGDSTVTIDGHVVDLGLPIMEAVEVGSLIVISLNDYHLSPDDPFNGRNIVAFDKDGNEVWRIEAFWHTVEARDGRRVPASYTGIDLGEDGKLYAYQGHGYTCEIDLKTGKIVDAEYTR